MVEDGESDGSVAVKDDKKKKEEMEGATVEELLKSLVKGNTTLEDLLKNLLVEVRFIRGGMAKLIPPSI
ncbi:hypothetical protein A2U01_0008807 [Trifolium medium]|uniref:Uncharacterized protein n=1 Tax=Trifolium medium TaxID=97028 RepID=A0A392MK79_9FABA|nr:hypothetical protein [Trifolium medium]